MDFSDATNYPKIFERTYWGAFNTKDNGRRTNIEQIYKNRNDFVQKENIKCVAPSNFRCYSDYKDNLYNSPDRYSFDHVEVYLTNDKKVVIINSPYHSDEQFLFQNGWEPYAEMYFSGVKTYIKRISKEQLKLENKINASQFKKK